MRLPPVVDATLSAHADDHRALELRLSTAVRVPMTDTAWHFRRCNDQGVGKHLHFEPAQGMVTPVIPTHVIPSPGIPTPGIR